MRDYDETVIDYDDDDGGKDYDDIHQAGGFCQPYVGLACSKFVGNRSVLVRSRLEQSLVEEQLAGTRQQLDTWLTLAQQLGQLQSPT